MRGIDPGETERPRLLPVRPSDLARELLEEASMLKPLVFRQQVRLDDTAGLHARGLQFALQLCACALLHCIRDRGIERDLVLLAPSHCGEAEIGRDPGYAQGLRQ